MGTAQFGVASGLFSIDLSTGQETLYTTGPENYISDMAAARYGIQMRNQVYPEVAFPCSDLTYTITIANGSGRTMQDIELNYALPEGFTFKQVVSNPFGGTEILSSSHLQIKGMQLDAGIEKIIIRVEVGNVAGDIYKSQAALHGLEAQYGSIILSDDPASKPTSDSTRIKVNRIEQDSLVFSKFLCLGESLQLDGSEYGNNLVWSTGSNESMIEVTDAGIYTLRAISACQITTIIYNVVVATCPYTIELGHSIVPEKTLACKEVVFRFFVENETGTVHHGLWFTDTLPEGFIFAEFLEDPLGGNLKEGLPPGIIHIENMKLDIGRDTFSIVVYVGDIPPATYQNQAKIEGFPVEIGPLRFSDDPATIPLDPTPIQVLGADSDSLYLEETLCPDKPLLLDASSLGVNHLWFDGSVSAIKQINEVGEYNLRVFDGCEETQVFYQVKEGMGLEIRFDENPLSIHLGDSIRLEPEIITEAPLLETEWRIADNHPIDCHLCVHLNDFPLQSTYYTFRALNESCSDSIRIDVLVDNSPRIYAPNIFSPNNDGVNDHFYLQSPDYGKILHMTIYDRWGRSVFESRNTQLNDQTAGWNGSFRGQLLEPGIYVCKTQIELLDGSLWSFQYDLTLLR